jgi:simple sugar transport system permease protein
MEKRVKDFLNMSNTSSILSSLIAIAFGLIFALIILLLTSPEQAFGGFFALLSRPLRNMKEIGDILYFATPLMLTGLSVAFAGKTGLFNIGATGQMLMGGYFAVLVGVKCAFLPGPLLMIAAVLAAIAAGAVWGSIPGLLKAFRNVNEVISCIMLNYISMYLVNTLVVNTVHDRFIHRSESVADHANLPKLGLDYIFTAGVRPSSVHSGIFIAIIAAIVVYIILQKTTLGFELKACGFNRDSARYAGVNEKRGVITAMTISGSLAGLAGAVYYLSGAGIGITIVNTLLPHGFQGIPVALLAANNPIGVIFSAIFIGYLTVGGSYMQVFGYTREIIDIIIAVIIYFSAFSLLMKGYIHKWTAGKRGRSEKAEIGEGGAADGRD